MEEDEQEQRRRKVEAGRAKLAHFRQRKTKGDCAHSKKKTAKRKGSAVDAPVQEERPVASEHGGLLGGGDACKSTSCSDTPDGAGAAQESEYTCEPAIAEHMGQHEDEAGGQQQAMGGRPPPTEEQQVQLPAQPAAALELEALRLSLSNMHAARLELAQAHLQREKDSALAELRDALNGRHAQELALLHSRQQLQLEEVALRCHQDTAELKEKLKSEVEKNVQIIETLKRDWESERDLCLENLRKELSAKHQSELENLRSQFENASAEQKAELEKTSQARSQAELSLQTLQAQHEAALRKLQEDQRSQRCRHAEDLQPDGREQEGGGQLQLQSLQASCEELKAEPQEGTGHLWSQLESTRTDTQEPRELPEQLLAQASGVDEWRHGQRDFEQWEQREKSEHEAELEQLRLYFERKLRDAERSHREDLTLLQQRLQEVREDPLLESVEISSSSAVLEETSEKEKRDRLDQLSFQLQQHEARPHVHTQLEDSRLRQVAAPQEADTMETQVLEPCSGPLEGPGRELTRMHLQTAQDMAGEVETAVAARVRGLGAKHEVKLSLLRTELKEEVGLLRAEQRSLHEQLRQEARLKEDCERAKHDLVEGHQEELRKAKEEIQLMKQEFKEREEEWQVACEALKREAEEQLTRVLLDARQQAAADRRSLTSTFQLREIEMRQLQDQQAAQIRDLEASLVEQQGRLRQLELGLPGDASPQCSQCGGEPGGGLAPADWDWELAAARLKEDCALQLKLAQNRFLEQRKEITERFTVEQDAFLREAQEKHAHELQRLQDRHQQHVASLTTELQAGRQADIAELKAALERHHWALSEARVAALQTEHAAEIRALETRHVSDLESVEARYLSEVEALRDDHRRALELLQGDREQELQREDSSPRAVVTRELQKVQRKQEAELQSAEGGPEAEPSAERTESLRAPVAELGEAHQSESESEQKAGLHDQEERRRPTCEQSIHQKEKEALCLQLQEKKGQVLQLKDRVASLSRELEARHSELERLRQTRDRENQEGANLIAMLKSDTDVCHSQRTALQDALRRLLGLFGETLKAAIALKSRISERVGLCLEDDSSPDTRPEGQAPFAAPALEEMWAGPDVVVPGLDGTLPEGAETSSVAEISSHLCESFFMSPESTLECEQPVRRVYQSLGLAVDGLLEMVLDSSRQLEEARQIHARFEKEFSCKSEEMAQVVRKHQELLEHLEEENAAKTRLTLELHKAEGIIEGFKVEKASLQESLGRTEMAERGLVVELEGLSQQLQQVTQQQAELKEENSILWRQKEAAAAEAQEREAALRREVEDVTKEQSEIRKQSEKDRCSLLAQMEVLEAELEEQLARHRACAEQAGELSALRQQLASLDKYLRSQRHFMDEQAVEREHEREEFQQEIRRLEEQLQQAARPQPWVPPDGDIELLQEKLREKSDELDELVIKKELADRQVLIQEEEIKHLEETNADSRREVTQLQEELQRQREAARELQQDKEALQEQQMSNLLLVSTLQSKLDEDKRPWPPAGSRPEGPEAQLEAVQRALLQRESEVLDLKEQLEKIKGDLVSKNEEAFLQNKEKEIVCVSEQLEAQLAGSGSGALSEAAYNRSSEVEELKSVIETLQENQERLQKDKADEIQQLHEVIERLQRELSPGGLMGRERSDGPAHNLQSELERGLLCLQVGGAEAPAALQAELQAALAAREALSRLLAEQECRHSQALEALQQRLRSVEEATTRRLAQPRPGAALREAEAPDLAPQIQEFEAALKAKDVVIAERDLEIEALNRQTLAHRAELEAVRLGLAHVCRTLERQPLGAVHEPPELQRLRAQCVRLSRQLQSLNLRFLTCQEELDEQQARGALMTPPGEGRTQGPMTRDDEALCEEELEHDMGSRQLPAASPGHGGDPQSPVKDDLQPAKALVTLNPVGLRRQDSLMSVLTVCQRQLESELLLVKNEMCLSAEAYGKDKEKLLEDCKLRKVDLITQVKQLQEKLNRLVYSMKFQNTEIEDFKSQQSLAFSHVLENSLSDSSNNGEETGRSPPVDAFNISKITRDLVDVAGDQDSWIRSEMPDVPMGDEVDLQDGSPVSLHSGCGDLTCTEGAEPLKNALSTMDVSWGSPEVVRKDSTLEPLPSLPLTPCSDASLRDRTSASLLQADQSGLLCSPGRSAAVKAPCWAESPSAADRAASTDRHMQRTAVEKDVEDFIITSLDSQEKSRSPPLGLEGKSDGSEKSDSGGAETLSQGPGGRKALSGSAEAPLPASHSFRWPLEAMKEKTVPAQHVEALLQMVCDESRHILALSEYHGPPSALGKGEPSIPLERFPRGAQGLLEAVPAPQKGEKFQDPFGTCRDWRGELLQAVREALAKERGPLPAALQPWACGWGPRAGLSRRPERAVQEPGDLQEKSSELLQLSDRGSLLSEVQALRAQLRLTHLQNQEKLQQLSTALTSTEARGSRREHQLRRQVELLAYKVEQEKCIASDLQKTLNEEQENANKVRKLLVVEENAVKALRSELCECKQDNERLLESLSAVQQEVMQLRSVLDGKEKDLRAALQELESARGEERALQGRLEQERRQRLQAEGQSAQALAELRTSLEKQCAQNNRLCVALKHEQTAKDNLQKELQIESSRCEALLAQERGRRAELHSHLEAEQGRSRELSEALQHERLLTERLSRRAQATAVPHAVQRKLKDEKARGSELQAALEEAQQQALRAQQQLEAQAQRHCEELKREKEVSAMLRSTVQALRTPGPELSCDRETERETPAWLQAEVEQLHTKLAEQGHQDTRRRAGTRQSRADADKWRRWQRDKEKLRELELQRQRHEHKIQQLQRMAREREAGEAARRPPEAQRLQEQQQGLEKIRQRLLVAAGLLTGFINQTVDRTINDWTSSNEKAVTSLLQTLEELKSELSASSFSQEKMTAEQQVQLVDVLLRDNDSLRKALGAVTQEKAALCRAASRLERTLSQHLLKGCALSRSDRSAWRRDRKVLQSSPRLPDPGLPAPAAREEAHASNVKMEKLYLHYLRAESFRKALIYQKKYLLLLIGGFQDSEQETLSMIAHLGVFPSKADKKITPSRPFTKFRTAVRVVIAISRLRFLVRKWQEVDRKGALGHGRSPHPGFPGPRQQQSPPETSESPPTRDVSSSHIRDSVAKASPHRRERSSPSSNSRSERSQTASQDPELSLTEYIHHLEMIQQRLGGVPPDPTSKKSCRQKTKQ